MGERKEKTMTDQRTLKNSEDTAYCAWANCHCAYRDEVIKKEAEIQQLKNKVIELETQCCTEINCCVLTSHEVLRRKRTQYWLERNTYKKQIETTKQILANWISLVNDHETCIKLMEVFTEETQT